MNRLQEAEAELIDRKSCNLITWYNDIITENMICAGLESGAVDACEVMLWDIFKLTAEYRFQSDMAAVCVCFRLTVRTRGGFIWSE